MMNTILEFKHHFMSSNAVCRLCMRYHADSCNVFVSNATNGTEIWYVIQELLNLEVAEGDGLPDSVCPHCLRKLMEFNEFKEMCEKSAAELKNNTLKSSVKNTKEVGPSESLDGEGTYYGDPIDKDSSQERAAYNVVCVPLEMGDQVTIKEEASSEEETYAGEDLSEDEPRQRSLHNVVCVPCEMGNQGNESSITQSIPKTNEMVPGNWRLESQGENAVKIESHSPPGQSLENNYSDEYQCDQKPVYSHENRMCDWTEYLCDSCGFECSDKNELCIHISGHISNEKTLKYSDGDMSVKGTPLRSLKTDKESKPFKCRFCGKEFAQNSSLRRHLTVHNESKQYKCDTCGKIFSQKSHLVTHLVIHTGSNPFKCETCGKGFNRKSNLLRHTVTHTGARPFRCGTCGKEFLQESSLNKHSNIHSSSKQFKCDKCWKVFNRKTSLLRHSINHSGLTPFKCETCGREFSIRGYFLRHVATHLSVTPFKCKTCGKGFSSNASLANHSIVHTSMGEFKCKTCGKAFKRKGALMAHSIIHIALPERF